MTERKKTYFDVVAYVEDRKRKIGYAYQTDNRALAIKADKLIDPTRLGRLMKKGIYIQKRDTKKQEE